MRELDSGVFSFTFSTTYLVQPLLGIRLLLIGWERREPPMTIQWGSLF